MKKKVALPIVITVFMVSALSYPVYQAYQPQEAMVVVNAPRECKIGELVTFDASESKMDSIVWNISPSTPNFKIIDNGKQAIFSSGKIGNYTITVAIANGKEVNLSIIKLTVYSSVPVLPNEIKKLIDVDGVKDLIDEQTDKLPGPVKQVINFDQVKNLLDSVLPGEVEDEDEDEVEVEVEVEDEVDIRSWLPSKDPILLNRIIKSFDILRKLMNQEKFETQDEMVQATVWSIKRATHEDESWKPFILNLSKYLENSDSKQDCIQKAKAVLISLKRINNEKT